MIKKWKEFNEEVSGTELVGKIGPGYGDTDLKNNTINKHHTNVNLSPGVVNPNSKNELTSDIFSDDEWEQLLNDFLKNAGQLSELSGDRASDINYIMTFINDKN
jgi:hypothetical protein